MSEVRAVLLVHRESKRERERKREREMNANKTEEGSRCSLRRRFELPTFSFHLFPAVNSKSIWTLKKTHRTGEDKQKKRENKRTQNRERGERMARN